MRNECWPINEANVLVAGGASATNLKNAKAAPHSFVASAREQKYDVDDDADRQFFPRFVRNASYNRDIRKVRKRQHQHPKFGHTQGEIFKKPTKKYISIQFKGRG